ncbi:MAG: hypothetical protein J2P39_09615 [Candidatus Dormibacteraeota bacterium]|nr:hypothetical protein [Candidatus Dormibacteraeota bacterium]
MLFGGSDEARYAQHVLFVPTNVVAVVGALLLLWALPLVYASPRTRGLGVIGRLGTALIFIAGSLFGVFSSLMGAILLPYLATRIPGMFSDSGPAGLLVFFMVATLCLVLGAILLAVPMVRGRVFTRWTGYVLLASAVFGVVGFLVSGPSTTPLPGIIAQALNTFLLFVGLGWMGYHLITMPRSEEALAS